MEDNGICGCGKQKVRIYDSRLVCPDCAYNLEIYKNMDLSAFASTSSMMPIKPIADAQKLVKAGEEKLNPYLRDLLFMSDDDETVYWDLMKQMQIMVGRMPPFQLWMVRELLIYKYSYAIPTLQIIDVLVKASPLLEIGAGTGYWSKLIKDRGGNVIAVDNRSWRDEPPFFKWTNVLEMEGSNAIKEYPNRNLMLCWHYGDGSDLEMENFKGEYVFFIGESEGTSDMGFLLDNEHLEHVQSLEMLVWPGMHDKCHVFKRRC